MTRLRRGPLYEGRIEPVAMKGTWGLRWRSGQSARLSPLRLIAGSILRENVLEPSAPLM